MHECREAIKELTKVEVDALLMAAKVLYRLEKERGNEVMFDSYDQSYVEFREVAEVLETMAGSPPPLSHPHRNLDV